MFAEKLRMEKLGQALERAGSWQECWLLLTAAAREWNWIRVKWSNHNGIREEVLAQRTPSWSFIIELTGAESVTVEGDGQTAGHSPDLIALSAILSQTLQRGRREWEQPALS